MTAVAMCRALPIGASTRPAAAPAIQPAPAAYSPPARRYAAPPRRVVAQAAPSRSRRSDTSPAAAAAAMAAVPVELLRRAGRTKQVSPDEVVAAMQQVEALQKQHSQLVQGFPNVLSGTWRLVFSSPAPIKQWQYIPVVEDAVIDVEAGTIDLVSLVGPMKSAFKGKCEFKSDPATGKFEMHFGFSAIEAKWFGRWDTRSEFSKVKPKVYTFFLLGDDVAAANSSGGPKTLMYRVK